jgi:hypothetical protein
MTWLAKAVLSAASGGMLAACGGDCGGGAAACALQPAVTITVSAEGAAGPVNGVTVSVSGATVETAPCGTDGAVTVCRILGAVDGVYEIEVRALGFQDARRTVTVRTEDEKCGCPILKAQSISLSLVPST